MHLMLPVCTLDLPHIYIATDTITDKIKITMAPKDMYISICYFLLIFDIPQCPFVHYRVTE